MIFKLDAGFHRFVDKFKLRPKSGSTPERTKKARRIGVFQSAYPLLLYKTTYILDNNNLYKYIKLLFIYKINNLRKLLRNSRNKGI